MTYSHDHIIADSTRIEQEARRMRAEFVANALRHAWKWATGLLPLGGTAARG
jgi:hypothetical protein